MPSFFEKLKKGMDINNMPSLSKTNKKEIEKPAEKEQEENINEPQEDNSVLLKPDLPENEEIRPDSEQAENLAGLEENEPALRVEKASIASPVSFLKTISIEEKNETKQEKKSKSRSKASAPSSKKIKNKKTRLSDGQVKKPKMKKQKTSPINKKEEIKNENEELSQISAHYDLKVKELDEKKEETGKKKIEKSWFESEGQLVVDLFETNDELVIQSAIGGIKSDELDISIENDMVTIKGKREKTEEKSSVNYFYQECHWGYFSREIVLPVEIDAKRSEADLKNGILTIRMPKIERETKKKLVVKE